LKNNNKEIRKDMSDLTEFDNLKKKYSELELKYNIETAKYNQMLKNKNEEYTKFKSSAEEMLNNISSSKAYKIVNKIIDKKEDILGSIKDYEKEWKDWYRKQDSVENVKLESFKTQNNQLLETLQTLKNKVNDPVKKKELEDIENKLKTITDSQIEFVSDTENALAQIKQDITTSTAIEAQKIQEELAQKTQGEAEQKEKERLQKAEELTKEEPKKEEPKKEELTKEEPKKEEPKKELKELDAQKPKEEEEKELAAQKAKELQEKRECMKQGEEFINTLKKIEDELVLIKKAENLLSERYKLNLEMKVILDYKDELNKIKTEFANIKELIEKEGTLDALEKVKGGIDKIDLITCKLIKDKNDFLIDFGLDSYIESNHQSLVKLMDSITKNFQECDKSNIDNVNSMITELQQMKQELTDTMNKVEIKNIFNKLIEKIDTPNADDTTCFNYELEKNKLTKLKEEILSERKSIDKLLENIQKLKNGVDELDRLKNIIKSIPGDVGKILEAGVDKIKEKFQIDNKEIIEGESGVNERLEKVMNWISKFEEKGEEEPEEIYDFNEGIRKIKNLEENIDKKIKSIDSENKSDTISESLRNKFIDVKKYINDTILFTQKIIQDNIEKLKNPLLKDTFPEVGANLKKLLSSDEITQLVNLNEDISGALRVYIKIKPEPSDMHKDLSEYSNKIVSAKKSENEKYKVEGKEGSFKITVKDPCLQDEFKSQKRTYGDFYAVYNSFDFKSNEQVFNGGKTSNEIMNSSLIDVPGLGSVTQQIKDGYSIILFGYGYSGSGKTATLLGFDLNDVPENGIVQLTLQKLKQETPGIKINLKYVFELYYNDKKYNLSKSSDDVEMSGKFYVWNIGGLSLNDSVKTEVKKNFVRTFITDSTDQDVIKKLIDEYVEIVEPSPNDLSELGKLKSNIETDNISDLIKLTTKLESIRKNGSTGRNFKLPKTVKATPNNNNSSRSHLFMTFEITIGEKTGYLTVIDMAGRESPIDILKSQVNNPLAKVKSPSTYLKSLNLLETQPPVLLDLPGTKDKFDLLNVVKEGFFINETINHMMWYFKNKVSNSNYEATLMKTKDEQNNKINPIVQSTDEKKYYVPANVFVNPKEEFENFETRFKDKEENNVIFITNVLDKLKNLGGDNENKISKFIVVCGLRKDEKCIDSAESTLDFASRVTSAGTVNPNI
jgi:hypothetical protein